MLSEESSLEGQWMQAREAIFSLMQQGPQSKGRVLEGMSLNVHASVLFTHFIAFAQCFNHITSPTSHGPVLWAIMPKVTHVWLRSSPHRRPIPKPRYSLPGHSQRRVRRAIHAIPRVLLLLSGSAQPAQGRQSTDRRHLDGLPRLRRRLWYA